MTGQAIGKPILVSTLISGTLDILFAMILTVLFGRQIDAMLRSVAAGPFPPATGMGLAGSALGLVVHFALMAVMAAALMLFVRRFPQWLEQPLLLGLLYGLVTYVIMNLLVVPLRFGTHLPPKPISFATQLFAHIVLVGIPMAYVAVRYLRPRSL
jgi:hypothetical protein